MDILKRDLAPISDAAWKEIDEMARETLAANLSGRKFLDVSGPHGIGYTSVDLGRLALSKDKKKDEVRYGVYMVQPLVESRIGFSLKTWELDNIERGALDIDLTPVVTAAKKMAAFEETAIFKGFKPGMITGIQDAVDSDKIPLKLENEAIVDAVSEAKTRLLAEGVRGASNLIVNSELWKFMGRPTPGGSLKTLVEKQIEGKVIYSGFVDTAILASDRGGDFELTLGQDFSIGYHHHDSEEVHLFFSESFSFRVITPEALVCFSM